MPTTLHTPAPTPDPLAPPTPAPPSLPPPKTYIQVRTAQPTQPRIHLQTYLPFTKIAGNGLFLDKFAYFMFPFASLQGDSPPGGVSGEPPPGLGRPPTLPSAESRLDPLEDEHSLHMLYDYTTVYAWLVLACLRLITLIISKDMNSIHYSTLKRW